MLVCESRRDHSEEVGRGDQLGFRAPQGVDGASVGRQAVVEDIENNIAGHWSLHFSIWTRRLELTGLCRRSLATIDRRDRVCGQYAAGENRETRECLRVIGLVERGRHGTRWTVDGV